MAVTIKRIAQELGISEASVSLALNQRPGVSERTRRRVLACAQALGYDLRRLRAPSSATTKTVCLVRRSRSALHDGPFFVGVIEGMGQELRERGYTLVVETIAAEDELASQLALIQKRRYAGILLMATDLDEATVSAFERLRIPLVLVDSFFAGARSDCVTINNRQGALLAAEALLAEGRGYPGHLSCRLPLRNFDERREGFLGAMHTRGLSPSLAQTHRLAFDVEGAEQEFSQALEAGLHVAHGYFADCDQIALGAVRALVAHGYRVPEDVSVIGFDDIELARLTDPTLSTIHVPKHFLGRRAVEALFGAMGPGEQLPVRIEVGVSLIRRGSTL